MRIIEEFIKEVIYAMENVPFYSDKLEKAGIYKQDLTVDNYHELLPFTEKRDYRKNFPLGVLAQGFSFNHPMLTKSQSSGTSGERLVTLEIGMNLLRRAIKCSAVQKPIQNAFTAKGRRICRYAAPNCSDVECANPHSRLEDRLLPDGTLVLPVYHDLLTTSDFLIERAIEEIQSFKPDLMYVDPIHYAFLLRECKKREVDVPKVPVLTSYSALTEVSKRQIKASVSEAPLGELFSSSEMGWLAMTCEYGCMHLNEESFFFEFIGEQGEVNELCVSSIDRGASPHLRYRTGDMVKQAGHTCLCGHPGRVITLEGRTIHFLTYQGKPELSPYQVDKMMGASAWLDLYQFEQTADDEFTLKIIVNDTYTGGEEQIFIEKFKNSWPSAKKLRVEHVNYIPSERSGKFQVVKGLHHVNS